MTNFLVVSWILNGESPGDRFVDSFGASDDILVLDARLLDALYFRKGEVVVAEVVVHLVNFDFLTILVTEPALGIFVLDHFDLFVFVVIDARQINRIAG